jgi:hypothetical protein
MLIIVLGIGILKEHDSHSYGFGFSKVSPGVSSQYLLVLTFLVGLELLAGNDGVDVVIIWEKFPKPFRNGPC